MPPLNCRRDKWRDPRLSSVCSSVEKMPLNHGAHGTPKIGKRSGSHPCDCWGEKLNVEYKGAHLVAKDQDKKAVGERWAAATGNAFEWVTEDRLPGLLQYWFKNYPAP